MGDHDGVHLGDRVLYTQTDLLHGTFTWGYQYTIEGLQLHEWATHFGSVAVLTDSAMQMQPMDAWQPAQLAFNTNILQVTWAHIGPLVVQAVLTGGWQWTDGAGNAAVLGAGVDLSLARADWLHLQGTVQTVIGPGADHGVHVDWQLPATFLNGRVTIPGT